ncbi:DUF2207 domain-containing protein [Smaragdicoccus niigatensis]|uniref:DUF2207 domain-containing protein n=1 Tax=Smaragdicoccus niigatensis TaxID=359359 RepID=UPI0003712EDB|nr:DUF2207 domain-containing protein [Smaragdicoccus niigatensis]
MHKNTTRNRRRWILIASVVGAIALAVLVIVIVIAGASERITRYQVDAAVQPDGSTLVREIIDYDFGADSKHGIFRFFPGYMIGPEAGPTTITDVTVRSASAPDDLNLDDAIHGELKIGSPDVTVTGRHQYEISYRLPPTAGLETGQMALDIVGTDWPVPIDDVVARIELPGDPTGERCVSGDAGSDSVCSTFGHEGRILTVNEKDLGEHQGITVYANTSGSATPTALPPEPQLGAGDSDWYLRSAIPFAALALLGYLAGLLPVTAYSRWLGRDWAWHGGGGAVDSVFGGPGLETRRIDDKLAEEQVTIQFVPPRDLTPAQGGVVLREKVTDSHRIAWLMDYSMTGWLAIESGGKALRWTAKDDRWAQAPAPLHTMFTGRHTIDLSSYDKEFAAGWQQIAGDLENFKKTSGLWDAEAAKTAKRRSTLITWVAIPVVILSALAAINLFRSNPVVTGVMGAVLGLAFGAAFAAIANRGELEVRTAKGFSQRQLTEGFRRFFQISETRHVEEAAARDELRLYTAWAIALDEVENWDRLVKSAQIPAGTSGVSDIVYMSTFASAARSASTAPSSSGSSGGGGGSVGGGGGGGGGGSW